VHQIDIETFEKEFFPLFITITQDKVPTVRLIGAQSLTSIYLHNYYKESPKLKELLTSFQVDSDRDVRHWALHNVISSF